MTSKTKILNLWQERYGRLSQERRKEFLAKCDRPEIRPLLEVDYCIVRSALENESELEKVLAVALELTDKKEKKRLYRLHGPTGKPDVATQSYASTAIGLPGGRAPYSSGLAHNPSAPDATRIEECSTCGASIPDGAIHDKCRP